MGVTEKDLSYERLIFSEEKLLLYKEKMNWKGKGTAGDPIIIDNLSGFPPYFKFKKTTSHVILENVTFYDLYCSRVENMTIRNCMMKELSLSYCINVNLSNNKIIEFKSRFTRGSQYENNEIGSDALTKLDSKFYDKEKFATKNNLSVLCILMIGPIGYSLVNAIFIEPLYWSLFTIFVTIVFFMIIIYFRIKKRITSFLQYPANILTNNSLLEDETIVLNQVLNGYSSYQAKEIRKALPYIVGVIGFVVMTIILILVFSWILS